MDSASLLDEDVPVFLKDFIAHGSYHGLELGEGRKAVLFDGLDVLVCFLLPVHTEYLVNERMRSWLCCILRPSGATLEVTMCRCALSVSLWE